MVDAFASSRKARLLSGYIIEFSGVYPGIRFFLQTAINWRITGKCSQSGCSKLFPICVELCCCCEVFYERTSNQKAEKIHPAFDLRGRTRVLSFGPVYLSSEQESGDVRWLDREKNQKKDHGQHFGPAFTQCEITKKKS